MQKLTNQFLHNFLVEYQNYPSWAEKTGVFTQAIKFAKTFWDYRKIVNPQTDSLLRGMFQLNFF
jgi:hypothetical protein